MSASAARHAAAGGICPGLVVLAAHDPGAAGRLAAANIARCRAASNAMARYGGPVLQPRDVAAGLSPGRGPVPRGPQQPHWPHPSQGAVPRNHDDVTSSWS